MSEQLYRDISVLETTLREVDGMLAELTAQRSEVESTAAAVEKSSRTAETEASTATAANPLAVAQDAVHRLEKDSLLNIKKLHVPSTGMKDTFDVICRMLGGAPHRLEGPVPGAK
jgi:hypothetical protein